MIFLQSMLRLESRKCSAATQLEIEETISSADRMNFDRYEEFRHVVQSEKWMGFGN
jgi:hypothetical protein